MLCVLTRNTVQVFNDRTAQADIDAVHSMGIFDNISITPQYAEGSTSDHPKVTLNSEP